MSIGRMIELSDSRQKMNKVLELLRQDLATMRAGRATSALVEKIVVEAYGTKMTLMELATISTPDPSQLLVMPFDQSVIKNIETALAMDRGLGLSPSVDGNVIRLKVPPLTEERRRELVKLLGQKLEASRIMIRQVRGDKMHEIREASQEKEMNEDEVFRLEQDLQKLTDEFNQKIEEVGKAKQVELTTV